MARKNSTIKILYLDIETAPTNVYTWSLFPKYIDPNNVQKAGYTLCWAAQWEGDREVMYGSVRDGNKHMLDNVWALLDEADAVVHYNGTKFDIPILNRAFVEEGLSPPSFFHQIDLLKTVRKQFRFESNKLDYICQRLGLGGKVKHKGMSLWYGCMEGKLSDWRIMERYNKRDVKILKKLYKFLLPWIHNHPNVGLWTKADKPTCHNCGSTDVSARGTQYNSNVASYKRYNCNKCHTPLRSRLSEKTTSENILVRTN